MIRHHHLLRALAFICSLAAASGVIAQTSHFQRINIGNRVSIEVPSHWHIRDLDERRNVAAAAQAHTEKSGEEGEPVEVSALSAVSKPEPVGAIVRVSFIPTEDLSQADLLRELKLDRSRVIGEVAAIFKQNMEALTEEMKRQGIRILGQGKVGIDTVGGLTAFTLTYRRTSPVGPSPFSVTQYHVPIGKEKALITLSYRESDERLFGAILSRVKRSIMIR